MKKGSVFRGIAMLLAVVMLVMMSGCVSAQYVKNEEGLSFKSPDIHSQQILNLKYPDWIGSTNVKIINESEKVLKSGFLDTSTEEFGYYILNKSVSGGYGWNELYWWGLITFPLFPFGFPSDNEDYGVTVSLEIYDSKGDLVKEYSNSSSFFRLFGWYYGWWGLESKVAKEYTKLYEEIFILANRDANEINQKLQMAGPITYESEQILKQKRIAEEQEKKEAEASKKTSSRAYTTTPSSSTPSSSTPSTSTSTTAPAQKILKSGTYRLSGTNLTLSLAGLSLTGEASNGFASLSSTDYKSTGSASFTTSNGRISITFITGTGDAASLQGNTYSYTINDSTSFSGHGETWVRTGY